MEFLPFLVLVSLAVIHSSLKESTAAKPNYLLAFERVESYNGTVENVMDFSKFRVIRSKTREYCLNGTLTAKMDLDNSFSTQVRFSYSPTGNSGYIRMPEEVPRQPTCDFFRNFFEKYARPTVEGKTNFPVVPPTGDCRIAKGTYYFDCATPLEKDFPVHLPRGMMKIDVEYVQEGVSLGGVITYLRVSDRLF